MRAKTYLLTYAFLASALVSNASAELINRGGGLIYDTVLDVTWLQDANLAFTNAPTLPDQCFPGEGGAEMCFPAPPPDETVGRMSFNEAMMYVENLEWQDTVRNVTWNDWRLPRLSPINGSSYNSNFTYDATTDEGYAPTTTDGSDGGWRDSSGNPVSELGFMFYVNLANVGLCSSYPSCPSFGLDNVGPFTNLTKQATSSPNDYWTGTLLGPQEAGFFNFKGGFQGRADIDDAPGEDFLYVWAVRDGDVSVVPVPAALWLLAPCLGMLSLWSRRR
ncbi:MAG: hypothetical protein ACU84Q_20365 [Gammaproteobacteria bacterium]